MILNFRSSENSSTYFQLLLIEFNRKRLIEILIGKQQMKVKAQTGIPLILIIIFLYEKVLLN